MWHVGCCIMGVMREREHLQPGRTRSEAADEAPAVGRSTLSERDTVAAAARSSFEDAEWEDIEHEQRAAPTANAAAIAPPNAANATTAPPVDAPDAKETVYSDQHHDPHAKRFEKKKKHAEKHHPKTDRYNQGDVKSDRVGKDVAARPGVFVNKGGHKDGVFNLKNATATRYLFVKHGKQNIAQPFDTVERAKLAHHNFKARGKEADAQGRDQRILLNPSEPRKLVIGGKKVTCVLSWVDGQTAAWIPVRELTGNTSKILGAVRRRTADWGPHRVSSSSRTLARKSTRYVIRNDKVGLPTRADDGDVLAAGAKSGDNVTHYLSKDLRKPAFGADGKRIDGKNVTRSIVPICMNLPGAHTPPVANDTAQAGESFFVMRDASFHRDAPVFENGKHQANKVMRWVFGHLGMIDANGKTVPDPSRRGWVPFRVLADAKHLETKQIEQRR